MKMSNLSSGTWIDSFPYDTDYCDHFETPPQAYDDIAPILDLLLLSTQKPSRSKVTIYDPYFCDGRAGRVLRELGFQVQHDKRDFYKDIQNGEIPHHDILVTNPPFSDQHKKVNIHEPFALSLPFISRLLLGFPFAEVPRILLRATSRPDKAPICNTHAQLRRSARVLQEAS
jgi:hypothetical protein